MLRRSPRVSDVGIAIAVDDLDEGRGLSQHVGFVRLLDPGLLQLRNPIARKRFLQDRDKREVAGKEDRRVELRGIGMLNRKIEAEKRFAGARDPRHKTNGLLVMLAALLNDRIETGGRFRQILRTCVTACNLFHAMPEVQCLRRFHDCRGGIVRGILPVLVIKGGLRREVRGDRLNQRCKGLGVAADRLQDILAPRQGKTSRGRSRGNHHRHKQASVARLLETVQVKRIVINLLCRRGGILLFATLKLQQENNVFIQQHDIDAFPPTRNHILKQDAALAVKRGQLALQNLDFLFPSKPLLIGNLRGCAIRADASKDLFPPSPQKSREG